MATSNNTNVKVVMEINIRQGRDLVAKDKNFLTRKKATSDPYILVYFGGRYLGKTETVKKTLKPTWNNKFEVKLDEDDSCQVLESHPDYTHICLRIFDEDKVTDDDFMGEVLVPHNLKECLSTEHFVGNVGGWYRVTTGDKNTKKFYCYNATGEVEVQINILEIEGLGMTRGTNLVLEDERAQVTLQWNTIKDKKIEIENSCVAINEEGNIIMDESVYAGHMENSNGSVHRSDLCIPRVTTSRVALPIGDKFQTIFSCNLISIPVWVRAYYLILNVVTPMKTLEDIKDLTVEISHDDGRGARLSKPNISEKHTALFLLRFTRGKNTWNVTVIEDGHNTARDFGTLIPQIKAYSCDVNPNIVVNPKERTAIMRAGRSICIKDYANNTGMDQVLKFVFGWKSRNQNGVDSDFYVRVISFNESQSVIDGIKHNEMISKDGSVKRMERVESDDGDKETISITLNEIQSEITLLGFVIESKRGKRLDSISKASCHLLNSDTDIDLVFYQILHEASNIPSSTSHLMPCCLYRESGDWNFYALRQRNTPREDTKGRSVLQNFKECLSEFPPPKPTFVPEPDNDVNNRMP